MCEIVLLIVEFVLHCKIAAYVAVGDYKLIIIVGYLGFSTSSQLTQHPNSEFVYDTLLMTFYLVSRKRRTPGLPFGGQALPLPSFLPPLPFPPFLLSPSSFPLPFTSPPPNPARGSGERCKLPSGVRGGTMAANAFLVYFEARKRVWR